jgi:hypothetical protein
MEQFSRITAKANFTMKTEGKRNINVKIGDVFLVTNPKHMQDVGIKIDRKNRAHINSGYLMLLNDIEQLFSFEV